MIVITMNVLGFYYFYVVSLPASMPFLLLFLHICIWTMRQNGMLHYRRLFFLHNQINSYHFYMHYPIWEITRSFPIFVVGFDDYIAYKSLISTENVSQTTIQLFKSVCLCICLPHGWSSLKFISLSSIPLSYKVINSNIWWKSFRKAMTSFNGTDGTNVGFYRLVLFINKYGRHTVFVIGSNLIYPKISMILSYLQVFTVI